MQSKEADVTVLQSSISNIVRTGALYLKLICRHSIVSLLNKVLRTLIYNRRLCVARIKIEIHEIL